MLFTNLIKANLKTNILGRTIEYYPFTDSTNDDLWELVIEDEANEGLVVITDDQRNGRGRRDNTWHSGAGKNLTFSILLKPEIESEKLGLFSLAAGLSICEGIKNFCRASCSLKWPNDILLNGKKIGGILIENRDIAGVTHLCIGIGLNVNEDPNQFPEDLNNSASSLSAEIGQSVQREPLLAEILNCFELYFSANMESVCQDWLKWCDHLDCEVEFHYGDKKIIGLFSGLNPNGYAEINMGGKTQTFAGGILSL